MPAEAGLAKQRALLVTRHTADTDGVAQQVGRNVAKVGAGRQHLRHQRLGYAQQRQQFVVPLVGVHIEQHGARGVAHIRHVHLAVGQLPDQPAVDRAKGQFTALGRIARIGHVVQQPLQFGAREVGIDQQPGLGLDGVRLALLAQLRAGGLGTAVLPDDGVVHGLAGLAVPQHGGFALVGDADGPDLAGGDACLLQRCTRRGKLGAPDFHRIMFHPARAGVDLGKFELCLGHDVAAFVEHDAAGTGGALVEGEQVGHGVSVGGRPGERRGIRVRPAPVRRRRFPARQRRAQAGAHR